VKMGEMQQSQCTDIDRPLTVHQGVIEFPAPPARNLAMENETKRALAHWRKPEVEAGGILHF